MAEARCILAYGLPADDADLAASGATSSWRAIGEVFTWPPGADECQPDGPQVRQDVAHTMNYQDLPPQQAVRGRMFLSRLFYSLGWRQTYTI